MDPSITARKKRSFDWTRDPTPEDITPFQQSIRDVDWQSSPLGPMDAWPDQLRQFVLLIVADPHPAVVYWGVEQAIVYNEAYTALIGQKHPGLQGQNPRYGGFAEIWDQFDQILLEGERTGQTHVGGNQVVLIHRHGYLEEGFFSWKFIPMTGPDGTIVASYATVFETTSEVISSRRSKLIRSLDEEVSAAELTFSSLWPCFIRGLGTNDRDITFAMVYANHASDQECPTGMSSTFTLQGTLGIPVGHECAPTEVTVDSNRHFLQAAFRRARTTRAQVVLQTSDGSLPHSALAGIECRGFEKSCSELAVCPIKSGQEVIAFVVIGLNPHKAYNVDYEQFLDQVIQVVTPKLSSILLSRERDRRAIMAREAAIERDKMVTRLREDMKFSRFADLAPISLCVTDTRGDIVYANESWYNFTGVSKQGSGEMRWMESVLEEDKGILEEAWRMLTVEKDPWTFQIRSKQPFQGYSDRSGLMEKKYRTGWCASYPELDKDGNVTSVMGIVVDISELKWTEEQMLSRTKELEQSEAKFRQFAINSPIGVSRMSLDGRVEFSNDAWRLIFGQPRENGGAWMTWLNKAHPEDRDKFANFFNDIQTFKAVTTIEIRLVKTWKVAAVQTGYPEQPVWILASGYAELGAMGEAQNIVCWVTEISAQKAAARSVTAKMEEAILLKNRQENFIDMISHEIRNPLSAVLHCTEEIMESIQNYNDHGQSSAVSGLLGYEPRRDTSIGLRNAMDAAQTILYCVEHQKRIVDDVLTLSKLDADLLEISPVPTRLSQTIHHALKIFDRELKRSDIKLVVEDDISLSKYNIDWVMLDSNRFLQILINLMTNAIKFTRSFERRQITVRLSASEKRPIESDFTFVPGSKEINQAVQASNDRSTGDAIYILLSVSDTGKGLTDDEKLVLFHRWAQASPKTHIEYGGSGLGLFISRQITELMGGQIGVRNGQNEGCTFAFFVKTRKLQDEEIARALADTNDKHDATNLGPIIVSAESIPESIEFHGSRIRIPSSPTQSQFEGEDNVKTKILVVEDNLVNQRVLVKQLRNRGYSVVAANNGVEALQVLQDATTSSRNFDVVLCDIEMPVMGGIDCVREIRQLEEQGVLSGRVPVIAVTANARSQHVQSALEAGMNDVTTKPYRTKELISQIERYTRPATIPPMADCKESLEP